MPNQIVNATQQNDQNGNPVLYTFYFEFDDGNGNTSNATVQVQASTLDSPDDSAAAQASATAQAGVLYQNWLNQLYSTTAPIQAAVGAPVQFANIVQPPALAAALGNQVLNPVSPANPMPAIKGA